MATVGTDRTKSKPKKNMLCELDCYSMRIEIFMDNAFIVAASEEAEGKPKQCQRILQFH